MQLAELQTRQMGETVVGYAAAGERQDFQRRDPPEVNQVLVFERQFQEFEPLELIHAPQVGQPRTANAGPAQVEPSAVGGGRAGRPGPRRTPRDERPG